MAEIKCTYCGSQYCDLENTKETFDGIIRHYYCNSCKKRFRTCYTKPAASGKWLLTLRTEHDRDVIEFYRDTNASIYYRLKMSIYDDISNAYEEKFMVIRGTPIIYTSGEIALRSPKNASHDDLHFKTIEMNSELTQRALENSAMHAVYQGSNCFSIQQVRNDMLLKDIAQWLRTTLKAKDLQVSSGGCYIATSVYGSYNCPPVWTLRRFRDDILSSTWYGRTFIRMYYAVSPKLVLWFGNKAWFQKIMRGRLDKLVKKLQIEGIEDTPYQDRNW